MSQCPQCQSYAWKFLICNQDVRCIEVRPHSHFQCMYCGNIWHEWMKLQPRSRI